MALTEEERSGFSRTSSRRKSIVPFPQFFTSWGCTPAVVHCFTGTGDELDYYLSLGCYIGITGWICDERRGKHLRELVKNIPADRLLLETDGPYLLPRDFPLKVKNKRNEPRFLPHIAETVARCIGKEPEKLAKETFANAKRFFGI